MVLKFIRQSIQYAFSIYFIAITGSYTSTVLILLYLLYWAGCPRAHKAMGWVVKCWVNALACWTYYAFPSKFVVTIDTANLKVSSTYDTLTHIAVAFGIGSGWVDIDDERNKHREIVIANHQIYSDWIYLWAFLNHMERAGNVKFALKREIMFVPLFGLAMKALDFIFLHRHWGRDMVRFDDRVRRIADKGLPYSLLIFPEGTTMTKEAREKSQAHAKIKDYPELVNVLLPRCTGLYSALRTLTETNDHNIKPVEGVLDLTVGYSGLLSKQVPETHYTLRRLYKESFGPEAIHINCSFIPISDIPLANKEEFSKWLIQRFHRKDLLLNQFFNEGRFEGIQSHRMPITISSSYTCFWGLLVISNSLLALLVVLCSR